MSAPVATVNLTTEDTSSTAASRLDRRLFLVLAAIALVYAFSAGLRTTSDFDLGWQLATGRWVVQHHSVLSTDVLSYTAQGQPWIYPLGAGVVLYATFLLGGYALISWLGALACVGTVALLLRRGSAVSAAIAIIAVPLIAWRTTPRADMFSVVLFAAFLSLLWENYQTGTARLWLLPWLMLAWVNLHFGFAAGLALLLAYVGVEVSETIFGEERRRAALQRLRHASVWLAASVLVTLANPWGWGIYRALMRQQRAAGQQQLNIGEWGSVPVTWTAFSTALSLRQTQGAIYLLLIIAVIAALLALRKRQLGAAILLLVATYAPVQHVRMGAVFACLVVVVASPILTAAIIEFGSKIQQPRMRSNVAWAAVCLFAVLAFLRSFDLVTNRHYVRVVDESTFGAGLGWWFPERAADFVKREHLPGEIFNSYDEGSFLSWKLGPEYRDYIDGRDTLFGIPRMQRAGQLLQLSPDSDAWQQEADRYNINVIILSLARFDGVQFVQLKGFCDSHNWSPVYMDEVSAVFVRRTPQTESLIQRFPLNCATAILPAAPFEYSAAGSYNQSANAASLLVALGRTEEALSATDSALQLFPDSTFIHWLRGNIFLTMGRPSDAEQEYRAAISLEPSDVAWNSLAFLYQRQGRIPETVHALQQASRMSSRPDQVQIKLAQFYLFTQQPKLTLQALDQAVRSAPRDALSATGAGSLPFNVAQGRSAAWKALGDLKQATSYQEEAVKLAPDSADAWTHLAKLYQRQGQFENQYRAEEQATKLAGHSAQ
jgi:tetratricopeptide (TPR) repeat protein